MKEKTEVIGIDEIKKEILYTDSIFRYIKSKEGCMGYIDINNGEIDKTSKQSVIMGYIKHLEQKIN